MYSNRGWSYSSTYSNTPNSAYRRRRLRLPRPPRLSPLPIAVAVVAVAAWYHFAFGGFDLRGSVVDAATGQPIAAARVWTSRASAVAQSDGAFHLDRVKPPDAVGVDAPGY